MAKSAIGGREGRGGEGGHLEMEDVMMGILPEAVEAIHQGVLQQSQVSQLTPRLLAA